jgi:hypothetical protein
VSLPWLSTTACRYTRPMPLTMKVSAESSSPGLALDIPLLKGGTPPPNKRAAKSLLLLNKDVHANGSGWSREMVPQAVRTDIRAVGPIILYSDARVRRARSRRGMTRTLRLSRQDGNQLALASPPSLAPVSPSGRAFHGVGGLEKTSMSLSTTIIFACGFETMATVGYGVRVTNFCSGSAPSRPRRRAAALDASGSTYAGHGRPLEAAAQVSQSKMLFR